MAIWIPKVDGVDRIRAAHVNDLQTLKTDLKKAAAAALGVLDEGELGFANDTREIYIGSSVGNMRLYGDEITPQMYGAVGDGITDDTAAFQYALDALADGQTLIIPPGIYLIATGPLFVSDKTNVRIMGIGKPTLDFTGATVGSFIFHGGAMTRTGPGITAYMAEDHDGDRVSENAIMNVRIISTNSLADYVGVISAWVDDFEISYCFISESDFNPIEIRMGRRPNIYHNTIDTFRSYGIFLFMCADAHVWKNHLKNLTGGVAANNRAICVKCCYDTEPCNHIIEENILEDIEAIFWIAGGFFYDAAPAEPYYIAGYEIVEGCIVRKNILRSTQAGDTIPRIDIGTYASDWTVSENKFYANNKTTYQIGVGINGDWFTELAGTRGQNHKIFGNHFYECDNTNEIIRYGVSCEISGNYVYGKVLRFIYQDVVAHLPFGTVDVVKVKENICRYTQYLGASGNSGIIAADSLTTRIELLDNDFETTPTTNGANNYANFYAGNCDQLLAFGNRIIIHQTDANHLYTDAIAFNGTDMLSLAYNYVDVDAVTAARGFANTGTDDIGDMSNNTFVYSGGGGASAAIQITKRTIVENNNRYIGAWPYPLLDQSTGSAGHLYTERMSYQTGITASVVQAQGQGPLTRNINVVTICANANDTVTLPPAAGGIFCEVVNKGAQTLQVFPASGDDLGLGLNTSTTVATGHALLCHAADGTTWRCFDATLK